MGGRQGAVLGFLGLGGPPGGGPWVFRFWGAFRGWSSKTFGSPGGLRALWELWVHLCLLRLRRRPRQLPVLLRPLRQPLRPSPRASSPPAVLRLLAALLFPLRLPRRPLLLLQLPRPPCRPSTPPTTSSTTSPPTPAPPLPPHDSPHFTSPPRVYLICVL